MRNTVIRLVSCLILLITASMNMTVLAYEEYYEFICVDDIWYNIRGYTGELEADQCDWSPITGKKVVYEGDIVVRDSVEFEGIIVPVTSISGRFGHLTSLYIPDTVEEISETAFYGSTGLDSVNLPPQKQIGICVAPFYHSSIRKFYFRKKPTLTKFSLDMGDLFLGGGKIEVVDIAYADFLHLKGARATPVKRLNLHHVDTISIHNSFSAIDYMVLDDTIPPVYKSSFEDRYDPDLRGEPIWKLLFVPDESLDAYKAAPLWRNFVGIYPKSRLDRVDSLLSSIEVIRDCPEEGPKVRVEGNEVRVSGVSGKEVGIYDMQGRNIRAATADGDEVGISIPSGVYIITCGNHRTKVVVK